MRYLLPFVLLFLQEPTPPNPPVPSAEVDAVITVTKSGGLTILDAAKSKGAKSFAWQIVPEKTPGFLVVDNGQRAVFAPGSAGSFVVVLAVSGADGQIDIDAETLASGPAPGPNPPGPGPISLVDLVKQWAASVVSETKHADAEKMATAFETVSSMIAAGAIDATPESVLKATKAMYEQSMGASLPAWRPWLDQLGSYMEENDSGNYVEQWQAVATGLRGLE